VTTIVPIALLLVLLALRLPVAFALIVAGSVGVYLAASMDAVVGLLQTIPYRSTTSYALLTIPMFILMAQFATHSGLTRDIFSSLRLWLGWLPGGLALSSLMASAGLAAVSGSSVASAATMAKVAVPEMRRHGYSATFALGSVATAGTLAVLIPPSTGLVLYGIITETSIGDMLLAGIIPGVVTTGILAAVIIGWGVRHRGTVPAPTSATWVERFSSMRSFWPIPVLIVLVLGGIYSGAVTVVEASAVGASAMFVVLLISGGNRVQALHDALADTARITAMIFTIIFGAHVFGAYLSLAAIPQDLLALVQDAQLSKWAVLGFVVVLLLIMGCFMDQVAILVLTLPILFPLMTSLGFNPIWFGIVVIKLGEIGMITPPLGLNVFVASQAAGEPVEVGFRGVWRFFVAELFALAVLIAFPALSTWLPLQSE
jgi:C4-dicarboxylate transporter DctM subunit